MEPEGRSAGIEKAAPKSRLQVVRGLLGLLGGLNRLALAGFDRCRVVDLADVVGLDRERLVLHAVTESASGAVTPASTWLAGYSALM